MPYLLDFFDPRLVDVFRFDGVTRVLVVVDGHVDDFGRCLQFD